MKTLQGPAGEPGRPPFLSWSTAARVFALGYGAGFGSAVLSLVPLLATTPATSLAYVAVILLCSFLAGFGSRHFLNENPILLAKWEARLIAQAIPRWYFLSVGLVNGYVPGVLVCLGLLFAEGQIVVLLLALTAVCVSPWLGIWWIATRKPRPLDLDYDDAVTGKLANRDRFVELPDLPATEAFGRRLGGLLFPNAVVALIGPLGAGKTHLTRAVAEGLGIANPAAVTSPTFTLVHEYPARLPIFHFDAYRLNGPNEFLDLGVSEYYEAGGVCLIEWADKVEEALPAERLTIRITPVDESRRRLEVVGVGERYETLVRDLASAAE